MRLLRSTCFEIILLATLVASSEVFDRYWASDNTQALVVERLPEPFMTSNIRDCADFIVREGHFAFEFLPGECTAISLSSDLCCEETSGSHIYVSELFDSSRGSEELPTVTDEIPWIKSHVLPPLPMDIATIPGVSSSTDDNDLQPEDGNVALKDTDGTIYTFPLMFLDVDNCIATCPRGPTCYYNRSSPPPTSHYLSDYCGGEIPDDIHIGDVIYSHRGFGCEYMPDELMGQDCVVMFNMSEYSAAAIHFFDLDDSDSCDGFSLTDTVLDVFDGFEYYLNYDICFDRNTTEVFEKDFNRFTISVTKQERLGFVMGPLFRILT